MKFPEIENSVKHLVKTSKCFQCDAKYTKKDVSMIASTTNEGLFEMTCGKCKSSTIVNVYTGADIAITRRNAKNPKSISQNDILDMKNFLSRFDGNFKNIL